MNNYQVTHVSPNQTAAPKNLFKINVQTPQHVSEITSPILVHTIYYLCNPDLRSSTQSSTGTQSINKSNMLCNKCRRNNDDHVKTTSNIRLVNRLLEATTPLKESREKTERLAMLHKHAKTNYSILADLNYVMSAKCFEAN
jgi:hypothetical protein